MKNNNYIPIFICIFLSYTLIQFFFELFFPNYLSQTDLIRYSSLLQPFFFALPIFYLARKNQNFSNYLIENSEISQKNIFKNIKQNLKFNFNFKPQILLYVLWGYVGYSLLGMGIESILNFIIPKNWLDFLEIVLEEYLKIQNLLVINQSGNFIELLVIIFLIAIIPAFCEEILFRGFLMQNIGFKRKINFAITISALIFSLIHFNILGFIPIFVIGIYLGALFYATQSIIPSIFFHFLNNFFVVIISNYGENSTSFIQTNIWIGLILTIIGSSLMYLLSKNLRIIAKFWKIRVPKTTIAAIDKSTLSNEPI